jgi:hypothetical protein
MRCRFYSQFMKDFKKTYFVALHDLSNVSNLQSLPVARADFAGNKLQRTV